VLFAPGEKKTAGAFLGQKGKKGKTEEFRRGNKRRGVPSGHVIKKEKRDPGPHKRGLQLNVNYKERRVGSPKT